MYPAAFRYHRPTTVKEAIAMIGAIGDGAKPLAGGQTLLPILKLRLDEPTDLVDLSHLTELRGVREEGGWVVIGALSTHASIAKSDVAQRVPILRDCAGGIADVQVRNMGTIGGSVSTADPHGDWPTMLHALDAEVVCTGGDGERIVPLAQFIVGSYATSLQGSEIVTAIRFRLPTPGSTGAYIAYKKAAAGYPICSAGVQFGVDASGVCTAARVVFGGAAATACRGEQAEKEMTGKSLASMDWHRVAQVGTAALEPTGDATGSAGYKRELLQGLLIKAGETAARRHANASIEGSHVYA